MENPALITVEEAKSKVSSKKEFYEAMIRQGFYLPPYGSKSINREYLQSVRSGHWWCPRFDKVQLRPCPCPPVKRVIFREIITLLNGRNWGIINEDCANTEWLLVCLSTLKPDHEFFTKAYVPTAEDSRYSKVKPVANIDNSDGFFDGLPALKSSNGKKSRGHFPFKKVSGFQLGLNNLHRRPVDQESPHVAIIREQLSRLRMQRDQ